MVSVAAYSAQSEIRRPFEQLDPTSLLAKQAVDVALLELEARGLDKEQYAAEVYTRSSSVYVIFQRRDLLTEEDEDSRPALTLEVVLSGDASRIVEAYFAK